MTDQVIEKDGYSMLPGQPCPMCNKKSLTLMEAEHDIPFFGMCFIFSMDCDSCKYHKADLEAAEKKKPVKITFEVSSEEDLKTRVVKSSAATIKFPHIGSIEPGPASNGYVTNIEGIINRMKKIVENVRDNEDDAAKRKKAKNIVKKLQKVLWGNEKLKITLDDPSGNSAIISDKV